MKPIIKWPGGKSRELKNIAALLPPFTTWVEPFVGGGAFFFRLMPQAAFLNDAEADLMDLYGAVREGDPDLREALSAMARDRERVALLVPAGMPAFCRLVGQARSAKMDEFEIRADGFELPGVDLAAALSRSVISKASRLVGLERKHDKVFTDEELTDHFETALQAGYYTSVRDHFTPPDRTAELARFTFVRQFCYGSMFRYSKTGNFNIPYGGISYNRADFKARVEHLFSDPVRDLLGRAELACGDFEAHLDGIRPRLTKDAFVFLDPPYDTEFSAYANREFGRAEQDRLARAFAALPSNALLVIQQTDYVLWLYEGIGRELKAQKRPFHMTSYGKTYGYNVRGRNERKAEHLLVMNYSLPSSAMRAL